MDRHLANLEAEEAAAYQKHLERFKVKRAKLLLERLGLMQEIRKEDNLEIAGPVEMVRGRFVEEPEQE